MKIQMDGYAIDLGNGYSKINDGRLPPWKMPSWVAEVTPGSHFHDLDPNSAHIRYLQGNREELVGKEWLVGQAAKDNSRLFSRVVDAGKIELSLQLVLGAIRLPQESPDTSGMVFINTLYTSLPDARRDAEALRKQLGRKHVLEINGQRIAVGWGGIEVKEEGEGAYQYALRKGIIASGKGTALLDVGCGTATVSHITESGTLNQEARHPFDKGVNVLGELIRSDYRTKERFGSDPQMHLILKGIERDLKYGIRGSFADIFEEKRELWTKDILQSAVSILRPFKDELDKILIVGGGAPLFEHKAKGRIAICSNPQFANVLGLLPRTSQPSITSLKEVA